jgi:FKBP-type peptidyl-prolyl cis-trans isomerase
LKEHFELQLKNKIDKMKKKIIVLLGLVLISAACGGDDLVSGTETDQINSYIQTNKLLIEDSTTDGLKLAYITKAPAGVLPKKGQKVSVNYAGYFLSGKKFDAGPYAFTLGGGQVISGFDIGVSKFKVGEKAKVIFPSSLGYGAFGQGSIPPNTPLMFELELLGVQ